MGLIEHEPPERMALLTVDRQGMPSVVRALNPGGMKLREGEVEYVRADLHRGAVEALETVERYYVGAYPDEGDVRDIYYEVVRPALRRLGVGGQ